MKTIKLFAFLALAFISMLFPAISGAASKVVAVTVKKTSIRADKQFFAPTVAEAVYKDRLEVLEESGGWIKVAFSGKNGWIHKSAVGMEVKDKGPSLFGGDDASKVSQEEVALAGKGFNSQVESEYKKKNPSLDFAAVDRMEKITVEDSKVAAFVKDGKLASRETGK
ncbi:MAG: hypothetical protein HY751_13520 [Nitrospinae bacterium]|nr:hypothetical protein [Nitrospinota bacterium]